MGYKSYLYKSPTLLLVLIVMGCSSVTRDKYILPNGYKGFFGVLYQSDHRLSQIVRDDKRLFIVEANGVCESGFGFAKGPIKQEFFCQDESRIESFDFALFYQMTDQELTFLKKRPNSLFAICIYADNINGGKESFNIYLIATNGAILNLQKNAEKIFFYLNSQNFDWQENKESLAKNIARLNKELAEKKPPFD